jgi:hypothetical protein
VDFRSRAYSKLSHTEISGDAFGSGNSALMVFDGLVVKLSNLAVRALTLLEVSWTLSRNIPTECASAL